MKTRSLAAATRGAALVIALLAVPVGMAQAEEFARVLAVKPVVERVETPVEECRDEQVSRQKPVKDVVARVRRRLGRLDRAVDYHARNPRALLVVTIRTYELGSANANSSRTSSARSTR